MIAAEPRLFDALGEAVVITDLEGRIVLWNLAAERLYGWSAAEVVGRNVVDVTPSDSSREQGAEIMALILRGETWEGQRLVRRREGTQFAAWVSAAPYRDDAGKLLGVIGMSREIGPARTTRHGVALACLSGVLGGSLEYEKATEQVARALVPVFADICSIIIIDERGNPRRIAASADTEARVTLVREVGREFLSPRVAALWKDVLATGRAQIVPDILSYLTAGGGERDEYTASVERTGVTSVLVAPLVARGKPSGVLSFGMLGRSGRVFSDADAPFAEDLGRRVGCAVENARLHTKLVASETALKTSEQTLSAIISVAADAVITIDGEHRITIFNRGAERVFGYAASEVLGAHMEMLLPERFRSSHGNHVRQFGSGSSVAREMGERGTVFGLRKTGEEFHAEAAISKVNVADKTFFTVMVRDVSERKRLEETLRLSQERLRVAMQASPAALFNQDEQLRYTWVQDSIEETSVLGKTDFDLLPPKDAEAFMALKRGVLETGTSARGVVHMTSPQSDGRYYDVTIEPLRDSSGRVVGITGATWEVTEQKRTENEQRLLAEFGAALMVATPNYEAMLGELARLGVRELADWFIIDVVEDGEIRRLKVASSDPAKAALGDAFARTPSERRSPQPTFHAIEGRKATLVTDVTREYVESLVESPAQLGLLLALDIQSLITVPLVARGRVLGAFALVTSRATRKYDERDLRFAQELARVAAVALDNAQLIQSTKRAVAARDEVLGVVAHDLRNPLNAVLIQAQLLQRRLPELGGGRDKPVDAIVRSARRMDRLIEDLLDVTQLEGGALKFEIAPVATRRLLEEALESERAAASEADLQFCLEVADVLPDVLVDRGRLLQAFENLIGNALKFTRPGGTIVLGAVANAGEMVFRVSDTGVGIPDEHLPHLFDRFWQATKGDRRGAGLGLPIVKGIIEAHRGRIWVQSQVGKGTAFYFTVPTVDAEGA